MYVVIMAGGTGSRFWPLSRRSRPKQLLPFVTERAMLAETILRLQPLTDPEHTLVVTSAHLVPEVSRLVPSLPAANILAEPVGRNTAPCIGLASRLIAHRLGDRDEVIGVFAADHHVEDVPAFLAAVQRAADCAAHSDAIVTLGIAPTRPETGYGYIEPAPDSGDPPAVARFVEKPDLDTARRYVEEGITLWNAGIFVFRARTMLDELDRQLPELAHGLARLDADLDTPRFGEAMEAIFPTLPSVSIDYGVMEGARTVRVVKADCGWSDLGHWAALSEVLERDAAGNVTRGAALLVDCEDTVVVNERPDHVVTAVGLKGLVVVATADATLVLPAERSQDVRLVVNALEGSRRDLLD